MPVKTPQGFLCVFKFHSNLTSIEEKNTFSQISVITKSARKGLVGIFNYGFMSL